MASAAREPVRWQKRKAEPLLFSCQFSLYQNVQRKNVKTDWLLARFADVVCWPIVSISQGPFRLLVEPDMRAPMCKSRPHHSRNVVGHCRRGDPIGGADRDGDR